MDNLLYSLLAHPLKINGIKLRIYLLFCDFTESPGFARLFFVDIAHITCSDPGIPTETDP